MCKPLRLSLLLPWWYFVLATPNLDGVFNMHSVPKCPTIHNQEDTNLQTVLDNILTCELVTESCWKIQCCPLNKVSLSRLEDPALRLEQSIIESLGRSSVDPWTKYHWVASLRARGWFLHSFRFRISWLWHHHLQFDCDLGFQTAFKILS